MNSANDKPRRISDKQIAIHSAGRPQLTRVCHSPQQNTAKIRRHNKSLNIKTQAAALECLATMASSSSCPTHPAESARTTSTSTGVTAKTICDARFGLDRLSEPGSGAALTAVNIHPPMLVVRLAKPAARIQFPLLLKTYSISRCPNPDNAKIADTSTSN